MNATPEPTPGLSSGARNQAKPAAASRMPKRLEGRRAHATAPVMTSAQPAPASARLAAIESPASEPAGSSRATPSDATPSARPATITASCLPRIRAPSHTHALRAGLYLRGPTWWGSCEGNRARRPSMARTERAAGGSRRSGRGAGSGGRRVPRKQLRQGRRRAAAEAGGADDGQRQRLSSRAGAIRGSGRPPLQPARSGSSSRTTGERARPAMRPE